MNHPVKFFGLLAVLILLLIFGVAIESGILIGIGITGLILFSTMTPSFQRDSSREENTSEKRKDMDQ
ncbi:hypothetical protein [Polycladomyces subterraneus]|uniref:Uncharacterized protein n=1 Tax=Polycladomyces subterraneus TaxID=1016997 RepID=A0ABT8IR43_9BACL|nr:hypothetical protein [Polycladomyces subterraneus]MDN4595237.1 hypothetical protein [Polycladomyces subterraneus]